MVTVLTGTGNSPLDVGRMPCTDTSDLSETFVSLSWKLLGTPSAGDTLETVALGNSNGVDHLILFEDGVNFDWLLEETMTKGDLVFDTASVDLNLHQVRLLLLERSLSNLGVGENTDNCAVFLNSLEFPSDRGTLLGVLLGVLGESLLLRLVPVLVEASLQFVTQVLGPYGGQGPKTSGGLDVADEANSDHLHNVLIDDILGREKTLTGGVSMTVTASTTSFLCILAPGRSRSRTMVVMPAL